MFEYRFGIKLKTVTANAAILKLMRKHFPNMAFSELSEKIKAHDYIYLTDTKKDHAFEKRKLLKLLKDFDKLGLETELFKEKRYTPASWNAVPMSRELLYNSVQQSKEIHRETLLDIERETEGFVSQEAVKDIEDEIKDEWENEEQTI